MNDFLQPYIPVAILFGISVILPIIMVILSVTLGPQRPGMRKAMPYESGITAIGSAQRRLPVRFYRIAVLFILFDVDIILLVPYALILRKLGLFGLNAVLIFIVIFILGDLWVWEKRSTRMGIEQKLGNMGVVTYRLEDLVNWGRTNAMWPMLFGLACCAIEMMDMQASHHDGSRFGMELMRPSPRQADLMIVAGRVSRKMAPVLRRLYDQMPDPKWVVAMGDCASCGGIFNNYAIVQGVDEIVPVDVYIAGCPPRPEALMDGILTLHERIRGEKLTRWGGIEYQKEY